MKIFNIKLALIATIITCFMCVSAYAKKNTIIIMTPEISGSALPDFQRSNGPTDKNGSELTTSLHTFLKQSFNSTHKYNVKVIRNGTLEKKISSEIADGTQAKADSQAMTYIQDNKARFLVNAKIETLTAERLTRNTTGAKGKKVIFYRDKGTLGITVQILDSGQNDGDDEGKGAGHQVASLNVDVEYASPYRRLSNDDKTHVNGQYWNNIAKMAAAKVAKEILDKEDPLAVASVRGKNVTLTRGSNNSDMAKGDKFEIFNDDNQTVAKIKIIRISANSAVGKIINKSGKIEQGYQLSKSDEDESGENDFF